MLSKFAFFFNTTDSSLMSAKLVVERVLRSVIALRALELDGGPEAIGDVREDLERLVGPTVSRALAARVLGISQTALDRHAASGSLAIVETPAGRHEVPLGELVSLAVELRRHAPARHPVAAALNDRRARAMKLTSARLLAGTDGVRQRPHCPAELRALAFHRAVAERLDPQLVRDAKRRLRGWQDDGRIDPRWSERWEMLLDRPLEEIRRATSTDDERFADLRQSSPFAGSLSEPERRRIVEIVRDAA
jgi:hypothetical protein